MFKGPPNKKQKREEYRNEKNENGRAASLPQKKFFRQRAHVNPFADGATEYPARPEDFDWAALYPAFEQHEAESGGAEDDGPKSPPSKSCSKDVEIADIGCGFGGLLFGLAPAFPETLIVGMEIRTSVTEFVQNKIKALRSQSQHQQPPRISGSDQDEAIVETSPTYKNVACIRANTMKFLPNYFKMAQLKALFFCFPDPHFKSRKHKQRIVSATLNSEYAYVLRPGGMVYTITDVEDLHLWMVKHFEEHDSFARVEEGAMEEGERKCVEIMKVETEEGKKVERNGGLKLVACFRRLVDPPWPDEEGT